MTLGPFFPLDGRREAGRGCDVVLKEAPAWPPAVAPFCALPLARPGAWKPAITGAAWVNRWETVSA